MTKKQPTVYILASQKNGVLYVGVTGNLRLRMSWHLAPHSKGFTKRYDVTTLVYYEHHETMYGAIQREKQIKHWKQAWKIRLTEEHNPLWRDLLNEIAYE